MTKIVIRKRKIYVVNIRLRLGKSISLPSNFKLKSTLKHLLFDEVSFLQVGALFFTYLYICTSFIVVLSFYEVKSILLLTRMLVLKDMYQVLKRCNYYVY